jgi:hypothetical protein
VRRSTSGKAISTRESTCFSAALHDRVPPRSAARTELRKYFSIKSTAWVLPSSRAIMHVSTLWRNIRNCADHGQPAKATERYRGHRSAAGFDVPYIELIPRPTPIPT